MRIGSLFTGYGGLDLAVAAAFDAETVWVSEVEPAACAVIEHRFPGVPNLGDITRIDWDTVPPVDIITGGSPCFVAGTPVLTRRGLVPIEDVTVGDEVWTHGARWRPVTDTMTRMAPTVEFRPGFYSTPDHRLWLREQGRKWNNDRRAYDRVLGDPDWIDAERSQGHYAATPISVTDVDHDKPETLTWWQVGRFLADGYTNHQVNVYIGGGKLADTERFPGWKHIQQETALKLTLPKSAAEAVWLSTHFGKGAHGKTLPAFVLALPETERREVLEGYWSGDGYAFGKRSMRSVSVSPLLTVGIQVLAASLGYSVSLHYSRTAPTTVIQGRTVNQRDWWSATATPDEGRYTERDDDWLWQKLRKEPARGPEQRVYDLTVADDHSFVAAGIVVHNCQDLSTAGKRAGMTDGTRSNLWVAMREGIAHLQPTFVVWENVRGAYSAAADSNLGWTEGLLDQRSPDQLPKKEDRALRALGRVLGDLADLGYDARWCGLRAADVGACHGRYRVFLLAWRREAFADTDHAGLQGFTDPQGAAQAGRHGHAESGAGRPDLAPLPTPAASVANDGEGTETWLARRERVKLTAQNGNGMGMPLTIAVQLLPTPVADNSRGLPQPGTAFQSLPNAVVSLLPTPSVADTQGGRKHRSGARNDELLLNGIAHHDRWGDYAAAVARHEQALGRPAPAPTEPGHKGQPRLAARFVEWMQMLPDGWVTDVPGVTRTQALKMLGNGVVPNQALAALHKMLYHPITTPLQDRIIA